MFKLIKYLKKSIVPIIIIVGLLVVQAMADLSLPDYTSKIVNIGIQQGGVENSAGKVFRESQMEKITFFMTDSEKSKVMDNYTLLKKEGATEEKKEKYPALKNENLYELNTEDEDIIADLNSVMAKKIVTLSFIEDKESSKKIKAGIIEKQKEAIQKQVEDQIKMNPERAEQIQAQAAQIPVLKPEEIDLFEMVKGMTPEQLGEFKVEIDKKLELMSDSMANQAAVGFVKNEYAAIGMDTDKMQNNYVWMAGVKMLGVALVSMIATVAVGYFGARVAAKLGRDLRSDVFKKVMSFSGTEMDKFSTATLITRSTNDIQQIQMIMVMLLRMVFYAPILGVGGFIKVLGTNPEMSWIIAVAVITITSIVLLLVGIAMPKVKMGQKLIDKINLVSREILTGMLVIRAFGTQKHEEKRFEEANQDLTKTNLFVNRIMSMMMPIMMLLMNLVTILIVWIGAKNIDSGNMQVGDMMAFIQYAMQIIMAFLMISGLSMMLPRASVAAVRVDEILKTGLAISDPKNPRKFDDDKKGLIEFKNVSFRYPLAEECVINNVSFTAKPGETTAFIGSTGSGKSTLVNLIPRFYDVTDGRILIDGVDIREVTQKDLRAKIGYVPQKGVLFSGDIESNLKYGNSDATQEEIDRAASIAQATEFIETKPEGYKTEISQGGSNVSGGQKQRLSIARAIAKNPEILIFDDSFSALDFKTDTKLRRALRSQIRGCTTLIVAQRISTILHAERIIVLDEGNVVGIGTHKELMETSEVYRQIALSQLSKEELANE